MAKSSTYFKVRDIVCELNGVMKAISRYTLSKVSTCSFIPEFIGAVKIIERDSE